MVRNSRSAIGREIGATLSGVEGLCPDCHEQHAVVAVDVDQVEWCCLACGAAFVSGHHTTTPAGSRTSSDAA